MKSQKLTAYLQSTNGNENLPQAWGDWSYVKGMKPEDIDEQFEIMMDWSSGSPKGSKQDWFATWRNWCRKFMTEKREMERRNELYTTKRK